VDSKVSEFLKNPQLLDNIVKNIQDTGVIGEELPIKAEILVCCSKLVKNKEPISQNLHPEDESGAGKDYVTEHVKLVVFYNNWIKYNCPTPTAVSYGQRKEKVKLGKDKNGKVIMEWRTVDKQITKDSIIYIKDGSDAFINSDDCKVLLEEEKVDIAKTIQNQAIHLKWEKPVVIITTADTVTGSQLIRRLPSLPLDSSEEQTKKINIYQLEKDCKIGLNKKPLIDESNIIAKQAFYELKLVNVNLFKVKDYIIDKLPKCQELIMRSLQPRLLDFIKFSTALFQYQREFDGTICFASNQDVDVGFEVFNYIYKDKFKDVSILNPRQRKILNKIKKANGEFFSVTQINNWKISGGVSKSQTYEDMKKIMQEDDSLEINDTKQPHTYGLKGDLVDFGDSVVYDDGEENKDREEITKEIVKREIGEDDVEV